MHAATIDALKAFLSALHEPPETVARMLAAAKERAPAPEVLLTTRAAAELLAVHPQTLFRYRRRGLLHSLKRSPRCIRWRKSEVEALASGRAYP
ncbi:MAG TPA: helix-turn-helix domain-containing protein [Kiritimatiellia bacterium]|nr:helix-turn-helix domain-containing protein [Kiritimatiellia bacterium]